MRTLVEGQLEMCIQSLSSVPRRLGEMPIMSGVISILNLSLYLYLLYYIGIYVDTCVRTYYLMPEWS